MVEKNKKSKDVILQVSEEVRKTVFGFIPGGQVFDAFWRFRENLKQKRILEFSESVRSSFEELSDKDFKVSHFTTEDFVDIVELVYIKVASTRSSEKVEYLRNVLVNQVSAKEAIEREYYLRAIEIIDTLTEFQLFILSGLRAMEGKVYRGTERTGRFVEHEISFCF